MVKIKKYTLEQLAQVKPVLSKEEKRYMTGGYSETADGYYLFTMLELVDQFGRIPIEFGAGYDVELEVDGETHNYVVYKILPIEYQHVLDNPAYDTSNHSESTSGASSGTDPLNPYNKSNSYPWPYIGGSDPQWVYDPFAKEGTYEHPYTHDKWLSMEKDGTWQGGCVMGTIGYIGANNSSPGGSVPQSTSPEIISYSDLNGDSVDRCINGLIKDSSALIQEKLGFSLGYMSVGCERISQTIKSVLSHYFNSNDNFTISGYVNIHDDKVYTFKVYNRNTGQDVMFVSLMNCMGVASGS